MVITLAIKLLKILLFSKSQNPSKDDFERTLSDWSNFLRLWMASSVVLDNERYVKVKDDELLMYYGLCQDCCLLRHPFPLIFRRTHLSSLAVRILFGAILPLSSTLFSCTKRSMICCTVDGDKFIILAISRWLLEFLLWWITSSRCSTVVRQPIVKLHHQT